MSERTEHLHLPPIGSLPLRKRLSIVNGELKKKPLKKAYTEYKKLSQGNPLLWNVDQQTSTTEDTIDSFKSAWLSEQQKLDPVEPKATKKPSATAAVKKKRPSISKEKTRKQSTDGKLYCVCRQPYDATRFMIACDRCDDWFHGECIRINEKESEFIDLYFCSKCSQVTGNTTLWKPKCANPACHKAARIGSALGHVSKYCSDSCGMQVARARWELVEMKRRQSCSDTSTSVVQLTLMSRRQMRVNSLADKQDRKRLVEIRKEKIGIRDAVHDLDKKLHLLSQMKPRENECGFDPALIDSDSSVCRDTECLKHKDWQTLMFKDYMQEKTEQFHLLTALETERNQVKSRMRNRRDEKQVIQDLVNETLCT